MLANDGARAWEVGIVEGVLERGELLVFVVAVDGDLVDQAVEFGAGLAGVAHCGLGLPSGWRSGGWVEPVKDEWRAADLAALEAADRAVQADSGAALVELDDGAVDAVEVAGAGVAVDPHAVTDAELGERLRRAGVCSSS
jgi:hypothetical protein